jgi:arylsulfatase A-like enzyme
MSEVLASQDEELARILDYLDRDVGDYVVIVTADHGHTPSTETSGAWPIDPGELREDVDDAFGVAADEDLLERNSPVGFFVDPDVASAVDATYDEIANFLDSYKLAENAGGDVPAAYADRSEQSVYEAAWPADGFTRVLACSRKQAN